MRRNSLYSLVLLLLIIGCKKEAQLSPSNEEEDLLVVKDNPSDPTDHAIYQFYQQTGIPSFYNDTLSRKQVGDSAGLPRYFYPRLALAYSTATGVDPSIGFVLPADKQKIIPLLNLLKNELLPRIPTSIPVHSILFVDSLTIVPVIILPDAPSTLPVNAYSGFNTLAIKIANPDTMSAEVKKSYLADILGAICFKSLGASADINLSIDFYSISRKAFGNEIYITDFSWNVPDPSKIPDDYGLIYYYSYFGYILTCSEQEDLRAYLGAIFNYSTAAFSNLYAAYPVTIEKFNVVKAMVRRVGFQFTD